MGLERMREVIKALSSVRQRDCRLSRYPLRQVRENQYRLLRIAYRSRRLFRASLRRQNVPGSYLEQGSFPRPFCVRYSGRASYAASGRAAPHAARERTPEIAKAADDAP